MTSFSWFLRTPALVAIVFLAAFAPNQHNVVVEGKKMDRNAGHEHRGVLTPYEPGPFGQLSLEKKDESILGNGKPVMKQILPEEEGGAGKAVCVQDVDAPKSAVWNQILNLNDYKGKVPKVKECKNYVFKKNGDGRYTIKTKMVVGVMPGYSYENYYDHTYIPEADSLVWSLDYDKRCDFDDVAGHWHLENHPSKPGCTRVFYACDLKLKNSVPGPVMNFLSKTALKTATGWVKKESEAKPEAVIPGEFVTQ